MWPQQGYGGYGGYQPQMQAPQWMQERQQAQQQYAPQRDQMGQLGDRLGVLKEQFKGAGTEDQAGITARMGKLQGRMDKMQTTMQPEGATGADRPGMGWRKTRREGGDAAPQMAWPQMQQGGYGQGWGGGGFNPQMQQMAQMYGGMGYGDSGYGGGGGYGGGYAQPQGVQAEPYQQAQTSQAYNPQAAQAAPQAPQPRAPQGFGNGSNAGFGQSIGSRGTDNYDTKFGTLTNFSGGHANVYKQMGGDENQLYNYNPQQGWKGMTLDEYKGYGDTNYASPQQYGAAAGQQRENFYRLGESPAFLANQRR